MLTDAYPLIFSELIVDVLHNIHNRRSIGEHGTSLDKRVLKNKIKCTYVYLYA